MTACHLGRRSDCHRVSPISTSAVFCVKPDPFRRLARYSTSLEQTCQPLQQAANKFAKSTLVPIAPTQITHADRPDAERRQQCPIHCDWKLPLRPGRRDRSQDGQTLHPRRPSRRPDPFCRQQDTLPKSRLLSDEEDEETKGLLLHGTKGGAHNPEAFLVDEGGKLVPLKVKDQPGAARTSVEHFRNLLVGKEPLSPAAEQALQVQLTIQALCESAKRGCEVSID